MFVDIVYHFTICVGILFFTEVNSEGNCQLKYPDGTILSDKDWTFGITLMDIRDDSLAVEILNYEAINIIGIETIGTNTDSNRTYATAELKIDNGKKILTVKLTDDFSHYEEDEVEEELKIKVIFKCSSDKKSLEIYQPILDVNNHNPEFLNAPYEYTLQMPIQKNFKIDSKRLIAARDIDITNKNITFSLDSKDEKTKGFSAFWLMKDENDRKKHYATLLTTDVIDLDDDVIFHIFAEDTGNPPRKTNTTLTIKVDNINSGPKFSQPLYTADCKDIKIQEANQIPIKFDNEIKVVRGAEPNMTISFKSIRKSYKNYFKLFISADFSKISFELHNPSKELLNEKFIILSLEVMKVRSSTNAILCIQLPGMLDKTSTTQLSFGQTLYRFEKNNRFVGTLMKEAAIIKNDNGTIVYSGYFQDKDLEKKISINSSSAEVKITEIMDPGIYDFQLEAKVKSTTLSAKTTVLFTITSTEIEFEYALRMVKVEEESLNSKILSLGDPYCTYVIQSQTPSQDWFYISDNFLSSKKIDRESLFFSNMSIAQVRLVIEATCTGKSFEYQERAKRDTEYNVILQNIPFTRSKMHIVAIITDINDNLPIWDTKIPKVIGYPTKEVSKFVLLPSVYRFSATDADIGENAIITYSLKNDATFYIHPKEGTLYVRQGIQIANNVTAVASDGVHESFLEISIRLLEVHNIVALHVANAVIEDVESILSTIQANVSNCWIRSIRAAVISDSEATMSSLVSKIDNKDSIATKTLLRIMIYGLEVNSNSALDSTQLRSVLESSGVSRAWNISKISFLEEIIPSKSNISCKNAYKITTIILSLIIGAAIVAFVIFMVRYRRSTIFV